jgi:hypothetical protein
LLQSQSQRTSQSSAKRSSKGSDDDGNLLQARPSFYIPNNSLSMPTPNAHSSRANDESLQGKTGQLKMRINLKSMKICASKRTKPDYDDEDEDKCPKKRDTGFDTDPDSDGDDTDVDTDVDTDSASDDEMTEKKKDVGVKSNDHAAKTSSANISCAIYEDEEMEDETRTENQAAVAVQHSAIARTCSQLAQETINKENIVPIIDMEGNIQTAAEGASGGTPNSMTTQEEIQMVKELEPLLRSGEKTNSPDSNKSTNLDDLFNMSPPEGFDANTSGDDLNTSNKSADKIFNDEAACSLNTDDFFKFDDLEKQVAKNEVLF